MQAGIINKTPEQWLKDQGEAPKRISEVLASFEKNATVKVCVYRKEHLFIRFHPVPDPKWTREIHGKKLPEGIYLPNYWADASALGTASRRASQFKGWLTDAEISAIAKRNYREITAVCWNWNEFDDNQLWKLELRGDEVVEGLEGPIAPQPQWAKTATEPASKVGFTGGATQVYLNPKSPFLCSPVDWKAMA
jgi:hypothetical protein